MQAMQTTPVQPAPANASKQPCDMYIVSLDFPTPTPCRPLYQVAKPLMPRTRPSTRSCVQSISVPGKIIVPLASCKINCLVAQNANNFTRAASKAFERKAIIDALHSYSPKVQKVVRDNVVLSHTEVLVHVHVIRKLARAAGLGCNSVDVVGVVSRATE